MENLQVSDNVKTVLTKQGRGIYRRIARGSYQNEKKITIKLFLNKRLKADTFDGVKHYSPYIQVSLKSQTTSFPATFAGGFRFELDDREDEIDFEQFEDLDINKNRILKLIEILNPFERNDFKISELALICTSLHNPIYSVLMQALLDNYSGLDIKTSKVIAKSADWNSVHHIIFLMKEDVEEFSKIEQEFWCLEQYCKLIDRKKDIQKYYEQGSISLSDNADLSLLGYLKGDFQKPLINEIGQEKANKIFKSINFVLETYFCKQIEGVKHIVNNIW